MKIQVDALNVETNSVDTYFIERPKICPICGTSFGGNYLSAHLIPTIENFNIDMLYTTYFCNNCSNCFSSEYFGNRIGGFSIGQTYPPAFKKHTFSTHIEALSPIFVEIYNEALQAESEGLTKICGLGYRKALEFLIKDYLSFQSSNDYEEIIKTPLSNLIKNKIDNPKIKILAERCAWLGNDETHYVRKHDDYNIQDLKRFLDSMITYIDAELTVLEALDIEPK